MIAARGRIETRMSRVPGGMNSFAARKSTPTKIPVLTQKRQNQARRRATTSSWRSCSLSEPNRLGQGIAFRKKRSVTPRATMTTPSAPRIDHSQLQPVYSWKYSASAGLVSRKTAVAARVSRRQWSASSVTGAPCGRDSPASGCSAVAMYQV
jgi:hypothetical protein